MAHGADLTPRRARPDQRSSACSIRTIASLGTLIAEAVEREHRLGRAHARLDRLAGECFVGKHRGPDGRPVHVARAYSKNWPDDGYLVARGNTALEALETLLQRIDAVVAPVPAGKSTIAPSGATVDRTAGIDATT